HRGEERVFAAHALPSAITGPRRYSRISGISALGGPKVYRDPGYTDRYDGREARPCRTGRAPRCLTSDERYEADRTNGRPHAVRRPLTARSPSRSGADAAALVRSPRR